MWGIHQNIICQYSYICCELFCQNLVIFAIEVRKQGTTFWGKTNWNEDLTFIQCSSLFLYFLNEAHARFIEIAFVWEVSMRVCVCVRACVRVCVCVCVCGARLLKIIHVK